MPHLLDGGLHEKTGEQLISLVFAVEVKIHILMYRRHFVRNGFVE
jgi:hypothetical protein